MGRGPDGCVVDGCGREWDRRAGLCRAHASSCALCRLPTSTSSLLAGTPPLRRARRARWRPAPGNAATPTALLRRAPATAAHRPAQIPLLDEAHWRQTEPAIGRGGEVSLRGLPRRWWSPRCCSGLQQRCRINAVKTDDAVLRAVCDDAASPAGELADRLRRHGEARIWSSHGLANCLIGHARRALARPRRPRSSRTCGT